MKASRTGREWVFSGEDAGRPMQPLFQAGVESALVPNLAGERERQAASPGERLYTLVHWGREELQLRISAVAGTGRVLKIQPRPTTADDLPLALRGLTQAFITRRWNSSTRLWPSSSRRPGAVTWQEASLSNCGVSVAR